MENKIIETVGTEVAKGAAKAAAKTLTTGQLVLGGIGCFLGGVVTTLGGIFVGAEGISIFHIKFPCAHYAKSRADFVAEFSAELVKADGQLFVGTYIFHNKVCHNFFGGRG